MIQDRRAARAQVSIKQNGYEIYQSTVPPGPFTIDDLYAAGNGGDLQVTIKEADGSRQVFSVPWSTVPVLQREGHTASPSPPGEYRSGNSQQETPDFFQSTGHAWPAGGLDPVRRHSAGGPLSRL